VISLLQTQLISALRQAFPSVTVEGLDQQWNGTNGLFSCQVDGNEVTGTMSVSSSQLKIHVKLPYGAELKINVDETGNSVARVLSELLS